MYYPYFPTLPIALCMPRAKKSNKLFNSIQFSLSLSTSLLTYFENVDKAGLLVCTCHYVQRSHMLGKRSDVRNSSQLRDASDNMYKIERHTYLANKCSESSNKINIDKKNPVDITISDFTTVTVLMYSDKLKCTQTGGLISLVSLRQDFEFVCKSVCQTRSTQTCLQ